MNQPTSTIQILTIRQSQVLELLAKGKTYKQISIILCISVQMIKVHVIHARARLGAQTREAAVAIAIEKGLIESSRGV